MGDKKLKILHTGDIHLGEFPGPVRNGENARMQDIIECMQTLTKAARIEQPDLILIDGDITNKSKLWGDEAMKEYRMLGVWLQSLGRIAPTIVTFGTDNHDNREGFKILDIFTSKPDVTIVTTPQLVTAKTKAGDVQVACIPGLDKAHFRALNPGMDPNTESQACSDGLADILRMFAAQRDRSLPFILAAHYTVVGCDMDNGQSVFMERDVVLRPSDIDAAGFDLVTLGHIHRAQKIQYCKTPAFYCGPLTGITFNEEGQEKGFWIHELEPYGTGRLYESGSLWPYSGSRFLKTPYRDFYTMELEAEDIRRMTDSEWTIFTDEIWPIKNKIVRVRYECDAETNKRFDRAKLERLIYEAGAFWVAGIEPRAISEELDTEAISESTEPSQALQEWMRLKEIPEDEVKELWTLAGPIFEEVSAKQPTGKLTGIFEPLHLEVKNYRSYREESFDFTKVRFATVNGPNGVGKSAFFSDAILDALYEEPREGDLGGWISTQEDARSGAITFTFRMGDTKWQVARTRTKSGKTTLALSEYVDGEWKGRSGTTTKETQEKIIALLGMDSLTFKSCVLIMQDAYAVFLDAEKTDRMKVLGDTMGLGIYEQLEEAAKERAKESRRKLTAAQDKIKELDLRVSAEGRLTEENNQINAELETLVKQIDEQEEKLEAQKTTVALMQQRMDEAEECEKKAADLRKKVAEKISSKKEQEARLHEAEELLAQEAAIMEAAARAEELKTEITTMKAKKPQLEELSKQRLDNATAIANIVRDIRDTQEKIKQNTVDPDTKRNIIERAEESRQLGIELAELDAKQTEWEKARQDVQKRSDEYQTIKMTGFTEIEQAQERIKVLEDKARMLDDAECIDIERAECRFLKDAKAAKDQLEAENKAMNETTKRVREGIDATQASYDAAVAARDAIGYDEEIHKKKRSRYFMIKGFEVSAGAIDAEEKLIAELTAKLDGLQKSLEEKNQKEIEVGEKIAALQQELAPLAHKEKELLFHEAVAEKKDRLQAAREIKVTAEGRISELTKEIDEITKEGVDLMAKAGEIRKQIESLDAMKAAQQAMQQAMADLQEREKGYHVRIGAIRQQLQEIKDIKAALAQERETEAAEAKAIARYQNLAAAFSQDGIPFQIIRTIVPELQDTANQILGNMTGGKMSIELRTSREQKNKKEVNALEVWIDMAWRGQLPYKSHSGGQRVKVALATVFGIAHLKAKRAGVQLGMMFVDEPPFLDDDGTQAYCDAMEAMAGRFPNMRIIAISHDPTMKARFPQQITVEATEQGSKIRFQ